MAHTALSFTNWTGASKIMGRNFFGHRGADHFFGVSPSNHQPDDLAKVCKHPAGTADMSGEGA